MVDPNISTSEMLPARVIEQLCFLASPMDRQIDKVVGRLGPSVDLNDVAEDFENYTNAIWMSVEKGFVSVETEHDLKSLDKLLEKMSGSDRASLWQADGLRSPEWEEVRLRARQILRSDDLLNYIAQPPQSAILLVDNIRPDIPA